MRLTRPLAERSMLLRQRLLASLLIVGSLPTAAIVSSETTSLVEQVYAVSRSFRVQTYQQHRDNRREYDRRIAAGAAVMERWGQREPTQRDAESVIDWFRTAASTPSGQAFPGIAFDSTARDSRAPSPTTSRPPRPRRYNPVNRPQLGGTKIGRQGISSRTAQLVDADAIAPAHRDDEPLLPLPLPQPRDSNLSFRQRPFTFIFPRDNERHSADASVTTARIAPAPAINIVVVATASDGFADSPPVDLSLLAAKIRSTNLSLQGLESELRIERLWSLVELEAAADLLAQRISDRELANTYLGAVPSKYLNRIEPLIGIKPILALLAQRTFELKIELTGVRPAGHIELVRVNQITERTQLWSEQQQD